MAFICVLLISQILPAVHLPAAVVITHLAEQHYIIKIILHALLGHTDRKILARARHAPKIIIALALPLQNQAKQAMQD